MGLSIVLDSFDRFDKDTNLLYPSLAVPLNADPTTKAFAKTPSKLTTVVVRLLSTLKLTETTVDPATGTIVNTTNLTILNFFLLRFGPMNEKRLVKFLMAAQVCPSGYLYFWGWMLINTPSFR